MKPGTKVRRIKNRVDCPAGTVWTVLTKEENFISFEEAEGVWGWFPKNWEVAYPYGEKPAWM